MKKELKIFAGIFIVVLALIITCAKNPFHPEKKATPPGNQPPETYLFLFMIPDTIVTQDSVKIDTTITEIDTTASKQVLHWWGDDSDGQVIGYYIQWDYHARRATVHQKQFQRLPREW